MQCAEKQSEDRRTGGAAPPTTADWREAEYGNRERLWGELTEQQVRLKREADGLKLERSTTVPLHPQVNYIPPVSDPCCFPLVGMLDKYFSVRQGSNLRGLILPRWHGCVATTESMWSSFWETGKGFGMLTHLGRWWQKHLFGLAIGDEELGSENHH